MRDMLQTERGKYQVVAFPTVGVCYVVVLWMEVSWLLASVAFVIEE